MAVDSEAASKRSWQILDRATAEILVHVNGVPITRDSFDAAFPRLAAFSTAADVNALAMDVLNRLINDQLILQYAAEHMMFTLMTNGLMRKCHASKKDLALIVGTTGWRKTGTRLMSFAKR